MIKLFKILKYIIYSVLSIILFCIVYLVLAFFLSRIEVKAIEQSPDVSIFLMTNGVHSDVVLPVKFDTIDWTKTIKYSDTKGKDSTYQYLAFGWGNRKFYIETPTWADLKFSTAFQAAFGLGESLIHATFHNIPRNSKSCVEIKISRENYILLANYIKNSFDLTSDGNVINVKTDASYGLNDAFYEAKGRYSLFYTCNTWTNECLKVCRQKACLWTPFDKGIFYHYKN